ncbi:ribosome-associated ATPase/putative transporter RbbA [Massilia oculi]|nr:ribosome-associated ATPase/putative transporter RbbA [Massilia oculi]
MTGATMTGAAAPVARVSGLTMRYGRTLALDGIDLALPCAAVTGVIGPDGAGKTSLLAVLAGARRIQHGAVQVLGGDMRLASFRADACRRIAYMPQGLGPNLLPALSVRENLDFFARLFGLGAGARGPRIAALARSLGLWSFLDRPAGQLSGGMKQKLGLCCALVHDPELLILDEPTTGVDPLSRARFWELIGAIRRARPVLSVLVATAYMDEARGFDHLVALDAGRVLAQGSPAALLERSGAATLEQAFARLSPAARGAATGLPPASPPCAPAPPGQAPPAIEAEGLWRRFGAFVAVRDLNLRVARGEIFGFIGSNGCGKSTTMKMLTGLLAPSGGRARLFGQALRPADAATRRRIGYMSQGFSLYRELSVRQNLLLHARLFGLAGRDAAVRCAAMARRFGLEPVLDALPGRLPPGMRQRLALAVALVHGPELLILDEPTSGVDPAAREGFWEQMQRLSRQEGVTIFVSTHFMAEAERCDRVALMHAGRILATGTPDALRAARAAATLEEAFVGWLRDAGDDAEGVAAPPALPPAAPRGASGGAHRWRRTAACCWREALELRRDPVRAALAALGSLLLMIVIGYGIDMDVEDLRYAVLDRDQSVLSRDYALNLSGSRYFVERPALSGYDDLDRRMRSGELALALEIPPGFGRAVARGRPAEVGAWIDGANPVRAETVDAYVQGMHAQWLAGAAARRRAAEAPAHAEVETRFRYNPDLRSLPAMAPAIIALLLLNLPAMQAALAVVREKELGSIVNLYVTPLRRSEFVLGKQAPYVALAMVNAALMTLLAVAGMGVPFKGSPAAFAAAVFLFCICSTGIGLLASAFTRSQIAAIFLTMIGTMVPAIQYAGLINPVTSLEGAGRAVGEAYPASHMLTVCRGVFGKALGMRELGPEFLALLAAIPVIVGLAIALLPKQER